MKLSFRTWMEVMGVNGGLAPPKEEPTKVVQGHGPCNQAYADFHGPDGADPTNPEGQLPPVKKKRLRMKKT
jgi:hypothetical protein